MAGGAEKNDEDMESERDEGSGAFGRRRGQPCRCDRICKGVMPTAQQRRMPFKSV